MGIVRKVSAAFAGLILLAALRILIGVAPLSELRRPKIEGNVVAGKVIFITLDGVRERDLFETWDRLQSRIRRDGFFFGARKDDESMWVSNTSVRSLAGYRAIFTGEYQRSCWSNECSEMNTRTLIDELVDHGPKTDESAVFASWKQIDLAIESDPRIGRSVAFEKSRNLGGTPALIRKLAEIEAAAAASIPAWDHSRKDRFTWAMARDYARERRPRFLYISLVDSDEYGHAENFAAYLDSLRKYEIDILALLDEIESLPEGRDVSVVITTDHGRGESIFKSHGWWIPTSNRIWAAVLPSRNLRERGVHKRASRNFRQVDIRPTLEYLLGIPLRAEREGDPLVLLNSEGDRSLSSR